jgi:ubiquinone/menaquinone biosynthesis C-methylase UbiE
MFAGAGFLFGSSPRVLAPGGGLYILEFTTPPVPIFP